MVRASGDKTFVFDVESDDVIVRFVGLNAKLPEFMKVPHTVGELAVFTRSSEAEVAALLEQMDELGLLEGSQKTNKPFNPMELSLGADKVEFMNFEQLLPEGANDAVYASYCACNSCGYCDNCSCSDC